MAFIYPQLYSTPAERRKFALSSNRIYCAPTCPKITSLKRLLIYSMKLKN